METKLMLKICGDNGDKQLQASLTKMIAVAKSEGFASTRTFSVTKISEKKFDVNDLENKETTVATEGETPDKVTLTAKDSEPITKGDLKELIASFSKEGEHSKDMDENDGITENTDGTVTLSKKAASDLEDKLKLASDILDEYRQFTEEGPTESIEHPNGSVTLSPEDAKIAEESLKKTEEILEPKESKDLPNGGAVLNPEDAKTAEECMKTADRKSVV